MATEIENRLQGDEALRASEERRKLDAVDAGLALAEINYLDDTGYLSSEAARLFGLGEAAMILPRAAIHATFHPDDRAEVSRRIEASLDPAGPGWFEMDHRVVGPDRKTHWLRVRKQVFFEGEGVERRPSRAMLAAFDVTKEKTASEALRASAELIRNVLDSLPQEVVVLDSAGTVIAVNEPRNRFARENDGVTEALSIGADYLKACRTSAKSGEPYASAALGGLEALLGGARDELMMEYPFDDAGGSRRWFVMHAARLGSGPAGVVLSHTDITPQKTAEEALRTRAAALRRAEALARRDEERLRLFIDHAPAAVAMLDRDMRYVSFSGRWLEAYGLAESILGKSYYDVFPELPERWKHIHRRALSGETLTADEDRFDRADGTTQWLRWEARPWFDAGGLVGGIVVFSEDVTERRRHEEQIQNLMNEVNHRAKNLLTVVQSIARLTIKGTDSAAFADVLEERIAALGASQDLLVKSNWAGVELSELIRSQLSHYAPLLGARIMLDGPPLRLNSSAAQTLGMAIHELGTNAAKYGALSNESGVVRIVWSVFEGGGGPGARLNWTEAGGPLLTPPARRGFGHKVTVNMAKRALEADVALDYAPEGLVWELTAPLANVIAKAL
ncbi:PAS domain-containing sensor histidine kinase [Methylocapsa palsarum]|uniref:Blue-light-activated histidine kinase n=1 Tax=Methylocapsa palsarum TaxID=1612308 RepID=A0A1I3ZXJ1_9HYPH|nr:PAS domain S-box protein [Methylocapsa palsarum]SFK48249.1 PAS domain S-box-containing protein [Methylocapsa palsarum]